MFEVKIVEIESEEVSESLIVSAKAMSAIVKGYKSDPFYKVIVEKYL